MIKNQAKQGSSVRGHSAEEFKGGLCSHLNIEMGICAWALCRRELSVSVEKGTLFLSRIATKER